MINKCLYAPRPKGQYWSVFIYFKQQILLYNLRIVVRLGEYLDVFPT